MILAFFLFFEFLAKKFVKQKLFCLLFAKNPKAVSGTTFRRSQTPPLLFGQKGGFGQKGTIGSRSRVIFLRPWTDGLFGFWPKSGGGGWQLLGPISLRSFLAKKGPERRGMPFLGPFFWPLFWGPGAKRGVIYQGTIVPFWAFWSF